jgi:hypothetical protein
VRANPYNSRRPVAAGCGPGIAVFFLDATYAQQAGLDVLGQLSIWRWNGTSATPLLAGIYGYTLGDEDPRDVTHLDGDVLRAREKGDFRSMFVTAPEPGRRLEWRIRITPSGVEDLGHIPLDPELDFVDQILAGALANKPLSNEVSPGAARKLRVVLGAAQLDTLNVKDSISLGEMTGSGVRQTQYGADVCIAADALNTTLEFKLIRRRTGFTVTDVIESGENPLCRFPQK